MALSPEEIAKQGRFAQTYARSQIPVILSVERLVCGCDYGGNSLTTRDEARQMAKLLGLQPGIRLLDVGAGAGWPGLYIAKETGCEAMLVDLPLSGLQVANERAAKDRILDRCWVAVADGSQMPFRDGSFDAVSHSDILCCLRDKRGVLQACRRVIRDSGRMVFTVIWIAPDLSHDDYKRALEGAPEFAEVESDYATLLGQTGWTVTGCTDVTESYASTIRRQIHADSGFRSELEQLLGAAQFADRQAGWQTELGAIEAGLIRRDLFVATPTLAQVGTQKVSNDCGQT
ncbi:MAG: methyltransferase domain-containing protein [Proteobacteria bacterium]|nr:methyltransferase domain-containing protein [Pseudomonadota bacterium]